MGREQLSDAEFRRSAAQAPWVPVMRTILADLDTPVTAYLKLLREASSPYAYLLESVEGGASIGRYSYLGVDPFLILSQRQGRVRQFFEGHWQELDETLPQAIRRLNRQYALAPAAGEAEAAPPFLAGGVGYWGYDMVRQWEKLPEQSHDDLKLDEARLMFFTRQIIFDHARRQMRLVACVAAEQRAARAIAAARLELDRMEGLLRWPLAPQDGGRERGPLRLRANMTPAAYQRKVSRIQEYIRAGDAFQVVLSQRFDTPTRMPAEQVYRALRSVNPSPYMFLLRLGDVELVGASPEMLVNVEGRELLYRPIAGTRPRGESEARDRELEDEMRRDPKENAEHVMLVDLGRNDIGRVADYGTVRVADLMTVEKYSHVQHLVSTVRGRLRPDRDTLDALMACFPAGTLTGAPKVRAMEIIDELEPTRRGVYGGSILYLDFSGNLKSCIAIRTILLQRNWARVQAGAGIVADSSPRLEHQECINKARAVLRALELARAGL